MADIQVIEAKIKELQEKKEKIISENKKYEEYYSNSNLTFNEKYINAPDIETIVYLETKQAISAELTTFFIEKLLAEKKYIFVLQYLLVHNSYMPYYAIQIGKYLVENDDIDRIRFIDEVMNALHNYGCVKDADIKNLTNFEMQFASKLILNLTPTFNDLWSKMLCNVQNGFGALKPKFYNYCIKHNMITRNNADKEQLISNIKRAISEDNEEELKLYRTIIPQDLRIKLEPRLYCKYVEILGVYTIPDLSLLDLKTVDFEFFKYLMSKKLFGSSALIAFGLFQCGRLEIINYVVNNL